MRSVDDFDRPSTTEVDETLELVLAETSDDELPELDDENEIGSAGSGRGWDRECCH